MRSNYNTLYDTIYDTLYFLIIYLNNDSLCMIETKGTWTKFYKCETSIQAGVAPKQGEARSAARMSINGFII